MRLDSADFPIDRKMVVALEDGICYETEKNSLAETWDRLLEYYSEKLREERRTEVEEEELYRMLCKARVEAETGRSVYELVDKGVLEMHKVRPRDASRCELKGYILDSCIKLLRRGMLDLLDATRLERDVWERVKGVDLPVRLESGEVRIYVAPGKYIVANGEEGCRHPADWSARGLVCSIRYRDVCLAGSVLPGRSVNRVDMVKEYFLEKSVAQVFRRNGIEIEVAEMEEPSGGDEDICKYVIEELKSGRSIREVFDEVSLYLSRRLVDMVVGGWKVREVLRYSGRILEDGLPEVFFVISGSNVVKATRPEPGRFEIFMNESPVKSFASGPGEP